MGQDLSWTLWAASRAPIEDLAWRLGSLLAIGLAVAACLNGRRRGTALAEAAPGSFPRRAHYWAWAVFYTLFLIYGSLLPFRYEPRSLEAALKWFRDIQFFTLSVHQERADWVATILAFLPLGFLWLGALALDRRSRWGTLLAACLLGLLAAAFSVGIEFAQMWFRRTVSQNDALASTGGALLGMILWLGSGQRVTTWLRVTPWPRDSMTRRAWLLRVYFVGLVIYGLLPLDFVLSRAEFLLKYREGRIDLVPLASVLAGRVPWHVVPLRALVWLPVGLWAGLLNTADPRCRGRWAAALAAVLGVEVVRTFLFTPYASTTNVLAGWCGVGLGLWLAQRRQVMTAQGSQSPLLSLFATRTWPWLGAALAYAFLAMTVACAPWDFRWDRGWTGPRLSQLLGAPLAAMYWNSKHGALTDALTKTVLFVPLGYFLARAALPLPFSRTGNRAALFLAAAVGSIMVLATEFVQVFQPIHTPEVTDFLLGTLGVGLGIVAAAALVGKRATATRMAAVAVLCGYATFLLCMVGVLVVAYHWGVPEGEMRSGSSLPLPVSSLCDSKVEKDAVPLHKARTQPVLPPTPPSARREAAANPPAIGQVSPPRPASALSPALPASPPDEDSNTIEVTPDLERDLRALGATEEDLAALRGLSRPQPAKSQPHTTSPKDQRDWIP